MAHLYPPVGHYITEPLPPIQEVREVYSEELHYQNEMEKMRMYLRERENTIQTQMIEIDTLVNENNFLKSEVNRAIGESVQYKDTLKRMYMIYLDQGKYIHSIQSANADLSVKYDHQNDKNASLFNEIQNMTLDKEVNHTRMREGDKKHHFDITSLTQQLNDKNIELSDMRRKVNDLIEIKRRLEEETAALRFSIDNLRTKMDTELREKNMRIEQIERTYSENNSLKNEEVQHLKNKVKELDMLLLKNSEQNRVYIGEISSLNKEMHDKNYEISKIKPNRSGAFFDTGSKENIRGALNQSDMVHDNYNMDTQPFNASGRRSVRFGQTGEIDPQDGDDYEMNIQEQQYQQDRRRPGGPGPANDQRQNQQGQGQGGARGGSSHARNASQTSISSQAMQDKMLKNDKQVDGDSQSNMDRLLELAENATRRRFLGLILSMWKAKFAISIKNRKGGITVQDEKKKKENDVKAENLLSNNLANNLIDILSYIRRSSVDILFELYQRSIDAAESKKINSLIIFTINLRELKVQFKGVNIILEMYNRQILLIRQYLHQLKSGRPNDALIPTITIATGKLWSRQNDERDQANKWIESTLNQAIEQKLKTSNEEKNKDIIFLFRLLTLKHKIKYPLQGTPYKVDYDLMSVLEHKICDGFRRAVSNEF